VRDGKFNTREDVKVGLVFGVPPPPQNLKARIAGVVRQELIGPSSFIPRQSSYMKYQEQETTTLRWDEILRNNS